MEHIGINETYCKTAILVGDPDRIHVICNHFGRNERLTSKRGYVISETIIEGKNILVVSTGIGSPSMAIAVEELLMVGVSNFIRIGTCGAVKDNILPGSIILSTGSVREEGTSVQYINLSYPAIADYELIHSVSKYLSQYGDAFFCGITHTKDSFYSEKVELQLSPALHKEQWDKWKHAGIVATDMETSCLYIIASLRKARACSILISVGEDKLDKRINKGLEFVLKSLPAIINELSELPTLKLPKYSSNAPLHSFLD